MPTLHSEEFSSPRIISTKTLLAIGLMWPFVFFLIIAIFNYELVGDYLLKVPSEEAYSVFFFSGAIINPVLESLALYAAIAPYIYYKWRGLNYPQIYRKAMILPLHFSFLAILLMILSSTKGDIQQILRLISNYDLLAIVWLLCLSVSYLACFSFFITLWILKRFKVTEVKDAHPPL